MISSVTTSCVAPLRADAGRRVSHERQPGCYRAVVRVARGMFVAFMEQPANCSVEVTPTDSYNTPDHFVTTNRIHCTTTAAAAAAAASTVVLPCIRSQPALLPRSRRDGPIEGAEEDGQTQ